MISLSLSITRSGGYPLTCGAGLWVPPGLLINVIQPVGIIFSLGRVPCLDAYSVALSSITKDKVLREHEEVQLANNTGNCAKIC
jgi:hypothetical protein